MEKRRNHSFAENFERIFPPITVGGPLVVNGGKASSTLGRLPQNVHRWPVVGYHGFSVRGGSGKQASKSNEDWSFALDIDTREQSH